MKQFAEKELTEIANTIKSFVAYASVPSSHHTKKETQEIICGLKRIYECLDAYIVAAMDALKRFADDCQCPVCLVGNETLQILLERVQSQARNLLVITPAPKDVYVAIGLATAISVDCKLQVVQVFKFAISAHAAYEALETGDLHKASREPPELVTPPSSKLN